MVRSIGCIGLVMSLASLAHGQTYAPVVAYTWERDRTGGYQVIPEKLRAGNTQFETAACGAEFVFPNPVDLFILDATIYCELEMDSNAGVFPHIYRVDVVEADGWISDYDRHTPWAFPPAEAVWFYKPGRAAIQLDVTAQIRQYVMQGRPMIGIKVSPATMGAPLASLSTPTFVIQLGPICTWCWADFDESGGVDMNDLFAFFADWQQGEPCADVDRSAGVDGDDIAMWIYWWQIGRC